MGKKILILDDDADFNSLLTDVFQQADYDVTSVQDPQKALKIFAEKPFDLVVTDHRMPTLTGQEFVKELFKLKPGLPVVMVSGYLDNETIRTLIREGVGGIFIKPLNIFSLLKKTAELLEKADEEAAGQGAAHSNLGFPFRTFPARAPKAQEFANKLHGLRSFKSNLLLVGGEGSPFEEICRDLKGFSTDVAEEILVLDRSNFTQPALLRQLQGLGDKGVGRVTLVVSAVEKLSDLEKGLLTAVARRDGLFGKLPLQTRFVFCLPKDVDSLYEEGVIDETLYMFLGTSEVRVPALAEIPEDIPILARQILFEEAREKQLSYEPALSDEAREYLRKQPWRGGVAELRQALRVSLGLVEKDQRITAEIVRCAYEFKGVRQARVQVQPLVEHLRAERDLIARSALLLAGKDTRLAAAILGVEESGLKAWVEPRGGTA